MGVDGSVFCWGFKLISCFIFREGNSFLRINLELKVQGFVWVVFFSEGEEGGGGGCQDNKL